MAWWRKVVADLQEIYGHVFRRGEDEYSTKLIRMEDRCIVILCSSGGGWLWDILVCHLLFLQFHLWKTLSMCVHLIV